MIDNLNNGYLKLVLLWFNYYLVYESNASFKNQNLLMIGQRGKRERGVRNQSIIQIIDIWVSDCVLRWFVGLWIKCKLQES